jgi:hypothetical protein
MFGRAPLVTTFGLVVYCLVWLRVAVVAFRAAPDWKSGRPGDWFRIGRRTAVAAAVGGIAWGLGVYTWSWT